VQKGPAHRQHLAAVLQVQGRRFVLAPHDVSDGLQVHHHRAVHPDELLRIELGRQFLQGRPDQALAALERHGLVTDIITQNVDGLHQRAGSSRVVELHGSLAEVVCLDCGQRYPREQIQAAIRQANPHFADDIIGLARDGSRVSSQIRPDGDVVLDDALIAHFVTPTCRACGLDRLKPDVVFFGGSVPRERVDQCFHLTDAAHALVVIGSSLQVMSGLRFVRRAARGGIPIAAVTRGTLRDRHLIDVQVDDGITETLRLVADNVAAGGRPSR